ncbi:MAG TPA: Rap1a/Tai family immunity protein [Steroidobacteraceae bacterium]|jgi:hypothetical protein|nr:Rap1a/Tai family immunity protein [Steroidobacteraceae bacterium]
MKTLLVAWAIAALLLSNFAAAADEDNAITAGDLQQLCRGTDTTSKNVCRVFIVGVVQGIRLGLSIADQHGARACVPGTMSAEGLESAVKTQLDERLQSKPADEQQAAANVIGRIVVRAFPCPQAH